ncbi:MAG: tetratricopeptide repeat protein [Deltaproteobacteria bacterium]|nr:tetratricopeptide repeat protein [Deltaproteobacteria bacterium]
MRSAMIPLALLLVACGGSAPKETVSKTEVVPVWESDVENTAYEFYRSVSKTLLRTNQPRRALKTISKMMRQRPKEAEPVYLMARAYLELDDVASARRSLNRVIELDDKYAPAHALLGMSFDMTGEHAAAVPHHKAAIELDPDDASYLNNLGFCYYLMRDYRRAVIFYRKAVAKDPGVHRIHNNLGFALARQGKMSQALTSFKLAGVPAQAYNNMGFVHEERGELERAYNYYLQALELDPVLMQARRNLERVCAVLGRPIPQLEAQ